MDLYKTLFDVISVLVFFLILVPVTTYMTVRLGSTAYFRSKMEMFKMEMSRHTREMNVPEKAREAVPKKS